MSKENKKHRKRDDFCVTMTAIIRACFCDADTQIFQNKDAMDFFLYLMKYDTTDSTSSPESSSPYYLAIILSAESITSDTPEIFTISNFLGVHLSNINDSSCRNTKFKEFVQKPLSELAQYSMSILGLDLNAIVLKEEMTQDRAIDIITICLLAGRHGLPHKKLQSFSGLLPSSKNTDIYKLFENKKRFTVIYGSTNERWSRFMSKYILNQLSYISHSINYDLYISNNFFETSDFAESLLPWLGSKYKNMKEQLYPAILNAYLNCPTAQAHYYIIYDIPSQESLNKIISECKLLKNVILVCDFDMDSIQTKENVSYLPFHDLYVMPSSKDIHDFLEKNFISDYDESFSKSLLAIANGNLFLLYAMELLIKNISHDQKSIDDFKEVLNNFSLQTASKKFPDKKYTISSINDTGRSGNYLLGHIRRLYNSILTVNEQLLVLLSALFNESGLTEKWITQFLSENAFVILESLTKKGLIYKKESTYYYEDSLLIPYSFLQGIHFEGEKKNDIFSDVFHFLNSLSEKICYQNCEPIDYNVLYTTIKITFSSLFSLLQKSDNNSHFSEIWYYHIICIKFFLENGDINSIQKIKNNFDEVAKEYTKRPGEKFKRWKKIYDIYLEFLDLYTKSAIAPDNLWTPYAKLIDRLSTQISKYMNEPYIPSDYCKISLSLIEIIISQLFRLYRNGIRNCRLSPCGDANAYYTNMEKLKKISEKLFCIKSLPEDKKFLGGLETALNTIIGLSTIYISFHKRSYIDEFNQPGNLFIEPRYKQLSWFRINCTLLTEQCCSGYALTNDEKKSHAAYMQFTITGLYNKLQWVPLDALEDYYYALIIYTLLIAPEDMIRLLSYINTDLQRYPHVYQSPIALQQIKKLLNSQQPGIKE